MANAIANVLDKMSIYIEEGELIVGNYASEPRAMPVYPEYFSEWISEGVAPGGLYEKRVVEEERGELLAQVAYWKDKNYGERMRQLFPPPWRTTSTSTVFH